MSDTNFHIWWSQAGSNRRPPACKAGALPAELWPPRWSIFRLAALLDHYAAHVAGATLRCLFHSRLASRKISCARVVISTSRDLFGLLARILQVGRSPTCRVHQYAKGGDRSGCEILVGLGRFELPTSPLSGVRSNQLSYRPKKQRGWIKD